MDWMMQSHSERLFRLSANPENRIEQPAVRGQGDYPMTWTRDEMAARVAEVWRAAFR